jgi:hypothetical protein
MSVVVLTKDLTPIWVQLRRSIESDLALSRDALRGHPPPRRLTEGPSSPVKPAVALPRIVFFFAQAA